MEQVSLDLRREFPDADGFSERNLRYMKQWYLFYTTPSATEKLYQLGRELPNKILLQPIREKLHQAGAEMTEMKLHQLGAEFPLAFALVPWRHHVEIISKCKTLDEALFYILKTINGNWSRILTKTKTKTKKWKKRETFETTRFGRMQLSIA